MISSLTFKSGGMSIRMHAQEVSSARAGADVSKRPAILLLHGSGGHIDFWTSRLAPFLEEAKIGLYAPHYFDRTGTVRADLQAISDGIHVPQWLQTVDDALRFTAGRPEVDPSRIVIAGISLGAFLALALAATLSASQVGAETQRIRALLDISGGLVPPYDGLASAKMPPTLILHGGSDTIVPVAFAHDLDRLLTQLKVPHKTEILEQEGHWFSGSALPRLLLSVSSFLEQYVRT